MYFTVMHLRTLMLEHTHFMSSSHTIWIRQLPWSAGSWRTCRTDPLPPIKLSADGITWTSPSSDRCWEIVTVFKLCERLAFSASSYSTLWDCPQCTKAIWTHLWKFQCCNAGSLLPSVRFMFSKLVARYLLFYVLGICCQMQRRRPLRANVCILHWQLSKYYIDFFKFIQQLATEVGNTDGENLLDVFLHHSLQDNSVLGCHIWKLFCSSIQLVVILWMHL